MEDIASRAPLDGEDLDAAIDRSRAALAALLGVPDGGAGHQHALAEAWALLGVLLDCRVTLAAARMDERDAAAVAAARVDRDEAIAVTGALLYRLPAGDAAWPEVALILGRLSYDRYADPWPEGEPSDPDDLDAACDLLLRGARYDNADERTTLYLFLALRDRKHLMACPNDARALMTWGRRLLAFPDAGCLGRTGLHTMLELELINRADTLAQAGSWDPLGMRPPRLAGILLYSRLAPSPAGPQVRPSSRSPNSGRHGASPATEAGTRSAASHRSRVRRRRRVVVIRP
jgi:hypothetical protein